MLTHFTIEKLNNLLLGIEPLAMPRVLNLGLFLSDDGLFENEPTNEVLDPNYKKQFIVFNSGRQNMEGVQFVGMTESYTPTHIALSGSFGHDEKIIAFYKIEPVKEYAVNEPIYFPMGSITINLALTDCV